MKIWKIRPLKWHIGFTQLLCFCLTHASGQWTQIYDGINPIDGVNGIYGIQGRPVTALAVAGTGKLFAGTFRGIYISSNNGSSWTPSNTGLDYGAVNSFAINGSHVLVAMNGGGTVFRSSDDGSTWVQVINGLPPYAVSRLEASGGSIFAMINNGGFYYSADNGTSWSAITSGPSVITSLTASGSNIFVGTTSGVFLSSNAGASWTSVNNGLTSTNIISLSASGSHVLAWTIGGTFLSTNSGSSWSGTGAPRGYISLAANGASLVAATLGATFYSLDNGSSWNIASGVTGASSLAIKGSNLFASNDNGVCVSSNNGISWTGVNIGLANASPYLSANDVRFIAANRLTVHVSTDRGFSWSQHTVGTTPTVSVLATGNTFLISTRNGNYYSTNNGSTWLTANGLPGDMTLGTAGSTLFAADGNDVYRSVNNGATWSSGSNVVQFATAFATNGNQVFAGTMFKGVYISSNSGVSWQQVNNSLPQINALAFNGNTLVCGTVSGVYISINAGVSWTFAGLAGSNINAIVARDGNIFAAHKSIDISSNNGVSWSPYNLGIEAGLGEFDEVILLANSGIRILAATSDGGVWISDCVGPPTPVITSNFTHPPTVLTSSATVGNQWYFNGSPVSGAVNPGLLANNSGDYAVQVTVDGCVSALSATQTLSDCIAPPTPVITTTVTGANTVLTSSAMVGNQWYFNGSPLSGAVNKDYLAVNSGSYSVRVTVDNCVSAFSASQSVVITGNVNGLAIEEIQIFPNPAATELIIGLEKLELDKAVEIKVFNLLGKVLFTESGQGGRNLSLDISELATGFYVVEARQFGKSFRARFVKL